MMPALNSRPFSVVAATVASMVALGACGSDDVNNPSPVATTVVVNTGSSGQSGTVGAELANPISVRVNDQNGNAMSGVNVTWNVLTGGGTVSSATSATDASGNAATLWTLGNVVGEQSLRAQIANGANVTILATGVAAATQQIELVSGNNQSFTAGGTSEAMVVRVVDGSGNPVSGATVNWTTTAGTLSQSTTTTGVDGTASVTLVTLGTPGVHTVSAAVGSGTPVTFTITGT